MPRGHGAGGGSGASFSIEADEFTRLMLDVKAFDKNLGLGLRRNIRTAAKPIVAEVKRTVLETPPTGGQHSVGTRAAIAKGIGVRISTAKKGGAVTIAASGRYVYDLRKPMLRLYNKPRWRHPVFGTKTWVEQQGRPYFDAVILRHREQLRAAVELALNEAAAALGRKR